MEESIRKLSGRAFKMLIRRYTTGKFKSIGSGMLVTAVLQSSSAVSLMILACVGAGIMTMESAIGVILGSNLGTTITAWIVATIGFKVKIESFALPLIGVGGLGLIFLGNSERYSNISKMLVGFGFLFLGLDYMKSGVEIFTQSFDMSTLPKYGLVVYLVAGLFLTAIMQSSSATIAIVLTALNAGIVTFEESAAAVIGANVGTTFTILLGAIGAVQSKKRVAFSHLVFNITTALAAILLLPFLVFFVLDVLGGRDDSLVALALFHTTFNLLGVLIFLPFVGVFAKVLVRMFPDRKTELARFITNTTPEVVEAGVAALKNEVVHLIDRVLRFNLHVLDIEEDLVFTKSEYDAITTKPKARTTYDRYVRLKMLQSEIFTFAAQVQVQELSDPESSQLNRYLHSARLALQSAKIIKDVKHNFDEFANTDNLYLNDQYTLFRKRLIATFLRIDKIMNDPEIKDRTKAILKTFRLIGEDDETFVQSTTQAISNKRIEDIEVSTTFLANRAFVLSSRQILLAIRDVFLTGQEIDHLEYLQELGNEGGDDS